MSNCFHYCSFFKKKETKQNITFCKKKKQPTPLCAYLPSAAQLHAFYFSSAITLFLPSTGISETASYSLIFSEEVAGTSYKTKTELQTNMGTCKRIFCTKGAESRHRGIEEKSWTQLCDVTLPAPYLANYILFFCYHTT